MINLNECTVKLSVIAVFESLLTRYGCKNSVIEPENWNKFAEYINISKTSETVNSKQACNIIDDYISDNGTDAINKICQFFGWNNMETVEQDILASEQLIQKTSEDTNLIKKIVTSTVKNKKEKKIVFPNGWYIVAIYNSEGLFECFHVSIEKSIHKTTDGSFDIAEIGYFPDKICINLDTHSDYDDKNGYNDYYDFEIKYPGYDFAKYSNLVEKILYSTDEK